MLQGASTDIQHPSWLFNELCSAWREGRWICSKLVENRFKIGLAKGSRSVQAIDSLPKQVLQPIHLPRRPKTSSINWFIESRLNPCGPMSKPVPNWLDSNPSSVMVHQEQFLVDPKWIPNDPRSGQSNVCTIKPSDLNTEMILNCQSILRSDKNPLWWVTS